MINGETSQDSFQSPLKYIVTPFKVSWYSNIRTLISRRLSTNLPQVPGLSTTWVFALQLISFNSITLVANGHFKTKWHQLLYLLRYLHITQVPMLYSFLTIIYSCNSSDSVVWNPQPRAQEGHSICHNLLSLSREWILLLSDISSTCSLALYGFLMWPFYLVFWFHVSTNWWEEQKESTNHVCKRCKKESFERLYLPFKKRIDVI